MPWVRLDDGFADHPKIEAVGPLAAWLHVSALCYSARHLTDGRIPKGKARRLTDIPSPAKHIEALLAARLWHDDGDEYVIHDYLEYQPSRADIERDREAARERMAKARRNKQRSSGEQPPNVPPNSGGSSLNGRSGNPIPSRPLPVVPSEQQPTRAAPPIDDVGVFPPNGSSPPATVLVLPTSQTLERPPPGSSASGYPSDFEAWWELYPRKVAKATAADAWKRARGQASWNQLLAGLERSIAAWQRERRAPEKIPHAATWLRGRRWEDEPDTGQQHVAEPRGLNGIRAALEARGSA